MNGLQLAPLKLEERLARLEAQDQCLVGENRKTKRHSRFLQGGLGPVILPLLVFSAAQSKSGSFRKLIVENLVVRDQVFRCTELRQDGKRETTGSSRAVRGSSGSGQIRAG